MVVNPPYILVTIRYEENQERKINMSKNMTKTSLAWVAGLALVLSGLTAAPAQATGTGLIFSPHGPKNELVGVEGSKLELRLARAGDLTGAESGTPSTRAAGIIAAVDVRHVTVGGKTAPTITKTVTSESTIRDRFVAAAPNELSVVIGVDNETTGATVRNTADGVLSLTGPSGVDYDVQFTIQVTYTDGSTTEIETVTFKEQTSVSANITVAPAVVGESSGSGSFSFSGINTGNFITSNFTVVQDGAQTAGAGKLDINVSQDTTRRVATVTAYSAVSDSQAFTYSATIAVEDVITVGLTVNDVEINKFFDSSLVAADAAQGKFTVSATAAYAAMDISVAKSDSVVHNTGTATSQISAETVVAEEGTKVLNFVIQLFTDADRTTAAAAGNAVTVTLTDVANAIGTTTISSEGKTLDVSKASVNFTKTTNSSGQIAFTVTADKAVDGESFKITATGSLASISLDETLVKFQEAAFTLLPAVSGNFTIAPKGSLAIDYTVVNQFGAVADADYQLTFTRVAGSGDRDTAAEYANWSYVAPISATGRSNVTIVDNGAAATEGKDTVTVTLQKQASSGAGFISVAGSTDTFVINYDNDLSTSKVDVKTNFNGIANAAGAVLSPLELETKTLVDYDKRLAGVKPVFATDGQGVLGNVPSNAVGAATSYAGDRMLRVFGNVQTAANAGIAGVAVKISGTGANFADASTIANSDLMKNDSIVVFTDATGSYETFVRSSVAGLQTISIDAQGVTTSTQVRFQESTGVASAMTLTAPASIASGARADLVATVVDKFGKPVAGIVVNFKDNGPGVLNAATATTDIFGEAQVTLTTVKEEAGSTVVTAFATIAGVNIVQTKTVSVGSAASASSGDGKVNVGSFNGKLVIYALNLDGAKISWKVAGKWAVANASGDALNRFDRPVGASGRDVIVQIYVDQVLQLTKTVTTK